MSEVPLHSEPHARPPLGVRDPPQERPWTGPPRARLQGYLAHKKTRPLGPYRSLMPRVLGGSWGGGRFLMGEVPLYRSVDFGAGRSMVSPSWTDQL